MSALEDAIEAVRRIESSADLRTVSTELRARWTELTSRSARDAMAQLRVG
jgi:hypothetical protein